ncbi:helix-turn-helix domain-containing protein [Chitinophaga oryziterrae]|uniref:Helix-turn-helix domain-containing protein n=1 Tax=Chitinophaga oryziterrae TaxID=1031224 RepID=A0A6N8J313_9BACT|nr:helix-turn-helix transcriptional regulator [Chitinophaga oryziterrae]MVT39560.1 helix-turn-helix domain-containing protein [Chitinophaga oryziterrae]
MDRIPIRHIHGTQKEQDFSESFSIRDIGTLLAGKDMVQELHRHHFFYILVLEKGAGNHDIDFTPYTVCDNAVFFLRPGQVHQLVLKAESTGYLIQFRDDFSNPLLRKASKINHYQLSANRFSKLLTILTYIFQEYEEKQEGYWEVIKANMNIFSIELARQYSSDPSGNVNLYMQERLEELLSLLETHVFNHKPVSEYAAMMNLSMYQLNAITRETLGKTCSELINEHIILEAKRYLLATSNQINQIADHLGYEDVSYFIRFFKKHTGHSPETFRYNFR